MKTALSLLLIPVFIMGCVQPSMAESETVSDTFKTSPPSIATINQEPITAPTVTPSPTVPAIAKNGLVLDARTMTALEAATKAVTTIPGPYSWEESRYCSSYVAQYMKQLGFPVNGPFNPKADYPNPFPWYNTVAQVKWLRENYPNFVWDAPLIDFLDQKLWGQISPGSVIYLQTATGHNGFNTYYHVVILVGYHADGSPQFAELAGGMDNASVNRPFRTMVSFYRHDASGWDVTPYEAKSDSPPLLVTVIDPFLVFP